MTTTKRTPIATLGEFGLIDHLTEGLGQKQPSTIYGVGDDAAVLSYPVTQQVLITSDMLLEGIHFDLTYTPLMHLGYKAVAVNLSDIYAMNGTPKQLVINLALSKRFSLEDVSELYAGMRLAAEQYHVDIVGGDTCSSLTGLSISITCIGEATPEQVVYRKGAHENDLICVSGNLGAAYMGLQLLEREKRIFDQIANPSQEQITPDLSGKEYILQRQLRPEPRADIIETLRQAALLPTSMIDISDGLSSELIHLCKQSQLGCRIYEDRIPIDYQTALMAEELNMNVTTCALNGGEDYELLFTLPLAQYEQAKQLMDVKIIGHMTASTEGMLLVTRDETELSLKAQGWNPLQGEESDKQQT